jgi:hypothetical protein
MATAAGTNAYGSGPSWTLANESETETGGICPALVAPCRYRDCMAGRDDVTTYEQLQAMTPEQQRQHFLSSIVWNLDDLGDRGRRLLAEQDERVRAREERLRGKAS